jgi:hypothetical protein
MAGLSLGIIAAQRAPPQVSPFPVCASRGAMLVVSLAVRLQTFG